jgi:hypothetical protein
MGVATAIVINPRKTTNASSTSLGVAKVIVRLSLWASAVLEMRDENSSGGNTFVGRSGGRFRYIKCTNSTNSFLN